ncbi:MAG TPA: MBL fold metallo-hydrolase [Motilibacteraceae bacterium]|nr:MBL fold metallo-hydrolase [Motilibacteraceae bacterium]
MVEVTWWGHATATVEDHGVRLLTDPVLTARLAHLTRRRGPLPGPEALRADAVLVSHLHADHLHLPSLRRLAVGTRVLVPRGAGPLLRRLPVDVIELEPGDEVVVASGRTGGVGADGLRTSGAVTVRAVPAVHDPRRGPGSGLRATPLGFLVRGSGRVYVAGDTALWPGMAGLAPDLALLPVGGWGPTLGAGHLGPAEAVDALRLLAAGRGGHAPVVVPVHWGTLWPLGLRAVRDHLFTAPGPRFVALARAAVPAVDVRLLLPGQTTRVRLAADRP